MQKPISTQDLAARMTAILSAPLVQGGDPAQPNLTFHSALDSCDGSSLTVTYRVRTYRWMCNPNGVVHGGVAATMMDNHMGLLTRALTGNFTPTITMTVNYARPIPLETELLITAHAVTLGRTTAQLTAQLAEAAAPDRVLVSACGVYHTARSFQQAAAERAERSGG